ncbi:MAG: hypothetical protein MI685_00190 [Chlorobiales bacterium]|nr:hypothetical protein [Chlorobiales bacterium]
MISPQQNPDPHCDDDLRQPVQTVDARQIAEPSLVQLSNLISANRWLIVAVACFFILVATLYVLTARPVYRIEGLVRAYGAEGGKALVMLTSPAFLEEFIRDKKVLPLIYPDKWDNENDQWLVNDSHIPDAKEAAFVLRGQIFSEKQKHTLPIPRYTSASIGMESSNANEAVTILEKLLVWVNEKVRAGSVKKAVKRNNYLHRRLLAQDSLLVERLMNSRARPEGSNEMDDFLRAQVFLSVGLEERQGLLNRIQKNTEIIMRSEISPGGFALEVLNPVTVDKKSIRPKKSAIMLLGAIGGVFAGFFVAFVKGVVKREVTG